MKKVFSTLLAAIMVFTMLAVPVFATDIEDGSEAYVTVGSMNVTKKSDTVRKYQCCVPK